MSIANQYIRIARAYIEPLKTIEMAKIMQALNAQDKRVDTVLVNMLDQYMDTLRLDLAWFNMPSTTAPQKRIVAGIISISTILDLMMMSILKSNGYFTGLKKWGNPLDDTRRANRGLEI